MILGNKMLKAVLDSTILVSAFLTKKGLSAELLRQAETGAFRLCLAEEILAETQRVLLGYDRIRKRYDYPDQSVIKFVQSLRIVADIATNLPQIREVAGDPNDDMILACAIKSQAGYLITRDDHLLSLANSQKVKILSPEEFIAILRKKNLV